MKILGIDPGYAITGYGLVESRGQKLTPLDFGVVRTAADLPFPARLKSIYEALNQLIDRYRPDALAVEELFFARNTTTAIGTAQARGVAVLAGANAGIAVYEYTPAQVKAAVTGYGKADKQQVQAMVTRLLALERPPRPDDAADALAIAICHAHTGPRTAFLAVGGYN